MSDPRPMDEMLDRLLERARRPWAEASWGALGALLLVVAVPISWLLAGAVITIGFRAVGASLEGVPYRYAIIGATQLVLQLAAFGGAAAAGARPSALGLRRPLAAPAWRGVLFGLLGFLVALGYDTGLRWVWPEAAARMDSELARQMAGLAGPLPLLVLFAVVVAPLGEELFFRGFVFAGLRRVLPFPVAACVSAIAFAAVHLMPWSSPQLVAVGLLAAWAYERERTIAAPLAMHATFNAASLIYSASFSPTG